MTLQGYSAQVNINVICGPKKHSECGEKHIILVKDDYDKVYGSLSDYSFKRCYKTRNGTDLLKRHQKSGWNYIFYAYLTITVVILDNHALHSERLIEMRLFITFCIPVSFKTNHHGIENTCFLP